MKFKHTEDTEVLDTIKNAERALNETGQVNGLITALANIITNFIVALGVVTLVCTRIPWLMIPVIISFVANSYTTSKVNKSRRKFFKEMGNVERGSTYTIPNFRKTDMPKMYVYMMHLKYSKRNMTDM